MADNVGLPNSFNTAFPTMGDAMARGTGAVPTPLVGPGNTPNPPVGIAQVVRPVGDGAKLGALPDSPLTPQTAGIPGASVMPMPNVPAGAVVNAPLIPGMPPAAQPDGALGDYGMGTR